MRYILALLFLISLPLSVFAQDGASTAQVTEQIVTVVPTEEQETPAATLEATPAAPVCEDGATCNFNSDNGTPTEAVDPLTGLLFMASGSLLTLLLGGLTLYIAGGRTLRGLMASMWFMAFIEFLYDQGKKRTPAAIQAEARGATAVYEEFIDRVTDGEPDMLRKSQVVPVEPPLMPPPANPTPTLPPIPPTE